MNKQEIKIPYVNTIVHRELRKEFLGDYALEISPQGLGKWKQRLVRWLVRRFKVQICFPSSRMEDAIKYVTINRDDILGSIRAQYDALRIGDFFAPPPALIIMGREEWTLARLQSAALPWPAEFRMSAWNDQAHQITFMNVPVIMDPSIVGVYFVNQRVLEEIKGA